MLISPCEGSSLLCILEVHTNTKAYVGQCISLASQNKKLSTLIRNCSVKLCFHIDRFSDSEVIAFTMAASDGREAPGSSSVDEATSELIRQLQAQLLAANQRAEEERRQKEEAQQTVLQAQRTVLQVQQTVLPLPFIAFMENMERHVFSTFLMQREASRSAKGQATGVGNKMYPRSLRPWPDFGARHMEAFNTLQSSLRDTPLFPSVHAIESTRTVLCRRRAIANEVGARYFIYTAIESPTEDIVTAHLRARQPESKERIVFQEHAYMQLSLPGEESPPKKQSPSKTLQPDRWVFWYHQEDDFTGRNIVVGECKPPQKLKIATLQRVLDTVSADTFFPEAIQKADSEIEAHATATEMNKDGHNHDQDDEGGGDSNRGRVPGHVLVAKALCQTYHYMAESGIEYGYIASGDSLVLLRVREDDPFTLFYHLAQFPVPHATDAEERREQNSGLRQAHETAVAYLCSLCLWACDATPRPNEWMGQLAKHAPRWPKEKDNKDKPTPGLCGDNAGDDDDDDDDDNKDNNDNNNSGGNAGQDDGRSGAGAGTTQGPTTSSSIPRLPGPSGRSKRGRSPTRQHSIPEQDAKHEVIQPNPFTSFIVEPPTLPYCTQGCLRGLMRGGNLDSNCPNVHLHREAREREMMGVKDEPQAESQAVTETEIQTDDVQGQDRHPLTAAAVCSRILAQLTANMDKDAKCLLEETLTGRYGVLFKLAVTGFGYTFVGKGVQAGYRAVLDREAVVYRAVEHLQGTVVPVFLGIIDLKRPIPLRNLRQVAHMMLMSYAGPDLCMERLLPKNVKWDREVQRTVDELEAAGVYNEDTRDPNLAWNAEVQRVMHFDFDQATVYPRKKASKKAPKEAPKEASKETSKEDPKEDPKEARKEVQSDEAGTEPPSATRSPLLDKNDWNTKQADSDDGRPAKRQRKEAEK